MKREPGDGGGRDAAGGESEPFLSRWSRRKQEAREQPAASPGNSQADSPAPELPPIDQLTFDSDYRDFFHPKVGDDVRRAALRKLFSDPHFNAMDGLDVYIDDYSKTEPIPAAMLAGLRQAQNILQWAKEDEEKRAREALERQRAAPLPSADAPGQEDAATASAPGTTSVPAAKPAES